MENFFPLYKTDIASLMLAIDNRPELWNQNNLRRFPGSPHAEAADIWLRFNDISKYKPEELYKVMDDTECVDYEAKKYFPSVNRILYLLMKYVEGTKLGRVMITRIPQGGRILPHRDEGLYAEHYKRYHIILRNGGATFRCGEETVVMEAGEVWWFNTALEHEVINDGVGDRVSLIVDIR